MVVNMAAAAISCSSGRVFRENDRRFKYATAEQAILARREANRVSARRLRERDADAINAYQRAYRERRIREDPDYRSEANRKSRECYARRRQKLQQQESGNDQLESCKADATCKACKDEL
jgi:hypothetical protein